MIQNILNIILGVAGLVIAIVVIIYFKMFVAKLFNVRVVDRKGKDLYDAESFDNINSFLKEKVGNLKPNINKRPVDAMVLSAAEEHETIINYPNIYTKKYLKAVDVKSIMEKRIKIPREATGNDV